MKVNLLKKGEKLTDFGWGIAKKKPIKIHYREVFPLTHIRTLMPSREEVWGEVIEIREGVLWAYPGKDYIICGVESEIYPIRKDIFHKTYDVIEEPQSSEG